MFDIKQVKEEATKQIQAEMMEKAKSALVKQMRVVAIAEAVVNAEKMKLTDIERQIEDGTI